MSPLADEVDQFSSDLATWASGKDIDIEPIIVGASVHFADDRVRPRSVRLTNDQIARLAEEDRWPDADGTTGDTE